MLATKLKTMQNLIYMKPWGAVKASIMKTSQKNYALKPQLQNIIGHYVK